MILYFHTYLSASIIILINFTTFCGILNSFKLLIDMNVVFSIFDAEALVECRSSRSVSLKCFLFVVSGCMFLNNFYSVQMLSSSRLLNPLQVVGLHLKLHSKDSHIFMFYFCSIVFYYIVLFRCFTQLLEIQWLRQQIIGGFLGLSIFFQNILCLSLSVRLYS